MQAKSSNIEHSRFNRLAAPRAPWPDYRAVWRWHFYAGLLCLPLMCWLACTGALYLFRPQIETWLDRPYAHVVAAGETPAPASAEIQAALAAFPGAVLHAFQLPRQPDAAPQLLIGRGDDEWRVWLHPVTLRVLKAVPEDGRLMNVVFQLHGELLLGDRGSMVVETAACWAIVMVLTGLYLWWPRRRGLGGVLYPRLRLGRQVFWRDLHAVAGIWMALPLLFLLISGLPWAANWGAYLDGLRALAGEVQNGRDWPAGSAPPPAMPPVPERDLQVADYAVLDRVVAQAAGLGLDWPVLVSPPAAGPAEAWTVRSDTQNRPQREIVSIDGATGTVLSRQGFGQQELVDRVVAVGVAAHEGQLFGWPNQLLGLLTALFLLVSSLAAALHWWRRRPEGVLGAKLPLGRARFSAALAAIVAALGLALPLFGASLLAVLAAERLALRRVSRLRRWLGLRPPGAVAGG